MKKAGRLKEKNYREFTNPTDIHVLQRNILLKQARNLQIEGVDTLSIKGLSRELALATYREKG